MGANSFVRLGRRSLSVLKCLQYHKQAALSTPQRRALAFHKHIIMCIPPKMGSATQRPKQPAILYSDAEYEPDSGLLPKLGWVLFPASG